MKNIYTVLVAVIFATMGLQAQNQIPPLLTEYDTITFEELSLEPDSYWNGSDESGGFTSGDLYFYNSYDPEYFSWRGWAYSNMSDDTTYGFMNQYSAITAAGFDPEASGGANYAEGYIQPDWMTGENLPIKLDLISRGAKSVEGFYITNSTWSALSMQNGDDFTKKFGGDTGDDPDWFKLMVWGYFNGMPTIDTVEFYLADFRFENNAEDYIVTSWEYVDLSGLGDVDSLKFDLMSTDVGIYGMNTPGYFCVDNFYLVPDNVSVNENIASGIDYALYPNPSNGVFKIRYINDNIASVSIFDQTGRMIMAENEYNSDKEIDMSSYAEGMYFVKLVLGNESFVERVVVKK